MPSPAKITPSTLMPESLVRTHLELAITASIQTQHRLVALSSAANAEEQWDRGAEAAWFLQYSDRKLRKLLQIFRRVPEILQHPNLKINCDDSFSSYGDAIPVIKRIKLGKSWATGTAFERTQTFIHEATHIAGRWVVNEGDWYGQKEVQDRALGSWMYPMRVTRSADSLGYYAMDIAAGTVTKFSY